MGPLGRLDAGDSRRGQNIALRQPALGQQRQGRCLHMNAATRPCLPPRLLLVGDIDHVRFTTRVEMRERHAEFASLSSHWIKR